MKSRPIIFSGPMVRAILDGRKTQTRRVVKPQPNLDGLPSGRNVFGEASESHTVVKGPYPDGAFSIGNGTYWTFFRCPYGVPGDELWVKETFSDLRGGGFGAPFAYFADGMKADGTEDGDMKRARLDYGYRWKSGRFMPRVASRLMLEVVETRIERLSAITDDGAVDEGVEATIPFGTHHILGTSGVSARGTFVAAFRSLNKLAADADPWLWVVTFKRKERVK